MDRVRGDATERSRGGASGHSRSNTAPRLVQFRDAVEFVLQCKTTLADAPSSSRIWPSLDTAQSKCKSAFLKLVRATDDADDVVRAAACYVRNTTTLKSASVIRLGEKYRTSFSEQKRDDLSGPSGVEYGDGGQRAAVEHDTFLSVNGGGVHQGRSKGRRNCAKKRLVGKDQDMRARIAKNATMKFGMCHQRTSSELFSITATRPLALDMQVLVWQILHLAALEKASRHQRRQTKGEEATEAALPSSSIAAECTGQVTSELALAKIRMAVPERAGGGDRKRSGRYLGEPERTFRCPSSPGADGSSEIRATKRPDTVHHDYSSVGRAQRSRLQFAGSPTDGGQSRQTGEKRNRIGATASSSFHPPSHKLHEQIGYGPWQPSIRAKFSAVGATQVPSHVTMSTDEDTAASAVAAADTTASPSRTPYADQRPSGPEPALGPNLSDKSTATTMTRQATRTPTLAIDCHSPPQPPQAGEQGRRRSIVQEPSTKEGRSVQAKPTQVGPQSSSRQAAAVKTGNDGRRREPGFKVNSERVARLFHNLRDDERVEAEISLCEELFGGVKKRLDSKKSWSQVDANWVIKYTRVFSGGYKRRDVHASINPMSAHHDAASCKVQYARPSFGASCRDGPSVIFRRVHERQVQGPTYYARGMVKWEQRRQIRRFFYESGNSSFVFKLVKMWEGESWERASESETKYYVFVQSHKSAQAKRHPVHSGRSLVAKVLDILRACGEQKSLAIWELPCAARIGGGTDQ